MGLTLVTPQFQQQVFAANGNVGHDGIHHEYLHARSLFASHLHVGWNPATGAAFYTLTDRGTHSLTDTARFTMGDPVIIGEYATWTDPVGTYTQIGAVTTANSIVWTEPALIVNTVSSSRSIVELPASEGVIAYVPDVTATWTHWSHIALPHSTTTSSGPGLIIIAWVRSFELLGQVVQRPDRFRRVAGVEQFRRAGSSGGAWISRPQTLYGDVH